MQGGRGFVSLTPEIDKHQEYWENVVSIGLTQIQRCEDARWKVRQAVEERKVIPVDFQPRPAQIRTKPPKRAA
jgi:hypothetical protein